MLDCVCYSVFERQMMNGKAKEKDENGEKCYNVNGSGQ